MYFMVLGTSEQFPHDKNFSFDVWFITRVITSVRLMRTRNESNVSTKTMFLHELWTQCLASISGKLEQVYSLVSDRPSDFKATSRSPNISTCKCFKAAICQNRQYLILNRNVYLSLFQLRGKFTGLYKCVYSNTSLLMQ